MGDCRQPCKIFIGGLSFETTDDTLRAYFSRYGLVTDAIVMKDSVSRRSRGFGFITYTDACSVDEALAHDDHVIDHRRVEAKRAVPRTDPLASGLGAAGKPPERGQPGYGYIGSMGGIGCGPDCVVHHRHALAQDERTLSGCSSLSGDGCGNGGCESGYGPMSGSGPGRSGLGGGSSGGASHPGTNKVFVGGLHYETRDGDFRAYFERFGRVLSAEVMFNRETHKSRGFGFVVFEAPESAGAVLQNTHHTINGKLVEVKAAVPRTAAVSASGPGSVSSADNGYGNGSPSAASKTAAAAVKRGPIGLKHGLGGDPRMMGARSPLESPHKLSPTHAGGAGVVHHHHHHHHHMTQSPRFAATPGASSYAAALRYGGQPPPPPHPNGPPGGGYAGESGTGVGSGSNNGGGCSGAGGHSFRQAQHSPVYVSHSHGGDESLGSPASTVGAGGSGGAGRGTPLRGGGGDGGREHASAWGITMDPLALGSGGLEQYATPRGNRSGSAASSQPATGAGGGNGGNGGGVFSPYQMPLDAPAHDHDGADLSPFFQPQPAPAPGNVAGGYLDAAMAGIAELRLNGSSGPASQSEVAVGGHLTAAVAAGATGSMPATPPPGESYISGEQATLAMLQQEAAAVSSGSSSSHSAGEDAAGPFGRSVWSTLFGPSVSISNGQSNSEADRQQQQLHQQQRSASESGHPVGMGMGLSQQRLPQHPEFRSLSLTGLPDSVGLGCSSSSLYLDAGPGATATDTDPTSMHGMHAMNAPLDRAPRMAAATATAQSASHLGLFF